MVLDLYEIERNINTEPRELIDEPRLCGILSHELEIYWLQVKPLIEKSLEYGDGKYTLDHIKQGLLNKSMQLWVAYRGDEITTCMVTQIQTHPRDKRLLLFLYSGESITEMHQFRPIVYEWAKEQGCQSIEIYGRSGWEKVLRPYGYEKIHTILRYKL